MAIVSNRDEFLNILSRKLFCYDRSMIVRYEISVSVLFRIPIEGSHLGRVTILGMGLCVN